ncbi:MAG: hypothetical protein IAF58_06905 [Leptolyngbya sp.]|nr:hypothetical protein [Candidatus Melainabacteria bacterium]
MASPDTQQTNDVVTSPEVKDTSTEPTTFAPAFDVSPTRAETNPVTPETIASNDQLISQMNLTSNDALLAQLSGFDDDQLQQANLTSRERAATPESKEDSAKKGDSSGGDAGIGGRGATDFTPPTTKDNMAKTTTDRADVTTHPNGKLATVETSDSNGKTRMEFDENGKPTRKTVESASEKDVSEYRPNGSLSAREFSTGGVTARYTFNEQGKQLTSEVRTPDVQTLTQFDENGKPVKVETADKYGLTVEQTRPDGTKTTNTTRLNGSTSFRQEDPNGDVHIRNFDATTKTTRTSNLFADGSSNSVTDSPKERFESQTEANGDFKTTVTDKEKGTIVVREGGKDRETVETKMRGA